MMHPTISAAVPILTKSGRAEAARPPLPDPTIVDLRTPSQPPEFTKFDHVLTGLHRGYPTKFPIPWIGPKIGLLYPARRPLCIPTIGDLPNPLEEPQTPKFDHVLLPVGVQHRDGIVKLSRSATVGKPETRRKENRKNDENNNSNKENCEKDH